MPVNIGIDKINFMSLNTMHGETCRGSSSRSKQIFNWDWTKHKWQ